MKSKECEQCQRCASNRKYGWLFFALASLATLFLCMSNWLAKLPIRDAVYASSVISNFLFINWYICTRDLRPKRKPGHDE